MDKNVPSRSIYLDTHALLSLNQRKDVLNVRAKSIYEFKTVKFSLPDDYLFFTIVKICSLFRNTLVIV